MSATLDLPARLALLLATTLAVMSFAHPLWNLGVLAALFAIAVWQRLPLRSAWPLIRASLVVFLLVGFCAAFSTSARMIHDPEHLRVIGEWGPLRFTVGGVLMGCTFVLRMLAMILATWMAMHDISVDDVLDLAVRWHLPSWLSILVSSAMAAIPNLARRREQIQQAQQARGQRIDAGNFVQRWKANVAIVVPLLTSSLVTAENLGIALSVRGYGANRTMIVMHDMVRRPAQVVLTTVFIVLGVLAAAGRIAFGWGRI
ncbi:energy-coupling factor transporter transmembrane component T [Propionimicrobium sp. PCR01-08-3]|uniref:energy-coupling factor transporter transmembrane component T family protein n=1 Tax=Propionimicrobium sp. PCR01-08-3 TaxID=3052086 RepID=UPI00255CCEBB|nr:energy-coupling factor transporter transmembrane component T [Propionimicrobium sp. PCR01-08-3]WIY81453.1 energy-coupling factor transporter transmembrane component T [Propionimicrobium sp. PCR01-08-3]